MKKKIYKYLSVAVIAVAMAVSFQMSRANKDVNITLNNIERTAMAGIEIPMHLSDGYCTCKDGICQDGNWIGFRPTCGTGDSDFECNSHSGC